MMKIYFVSINGKGPLHLGGYHALQSGHYPSPF
jgi:hypothetical protein